MGAIFGATLLILLILLGVASIITGIIFFTDHAKYSWVSVLLIPAGIWLLIISAWVLDKVTLPEDSQMKTEEQLPSIEEGYNYYPCCGEEIK